MDFPQLSASDTIKIVFQLIVILLILVLVLWRIRLMLGIGKSNEHPFTKSFYKKLHAGFYTWCSDRILGDFGLYKLFDNYEDGGLRRIELLEKSVKTYPTARALADLVHLIYSRKVMSNQSQEEKKENFQTVTDYVQKALALEPDDFDLYALQANHFIWSVNLSNEGGDSDLSKEDETAIVKILDKGITVLESMSLMGQRKHSYKAEGIYQFRIMFLLRDGQFEKVLNDISKMSRITKIPNHTNCQFKIGALVFLGRYDDAIIEFERWSSKYHQDWFKVPSEQYTLLKEMQQESAGLMQLLEKNEGFSLSLNGLFEMREQTSNPFISNKINLLLEQMKTATRYFSSHRGGPRTLDVK